MQLCSYGTSFLPYFLLLLNKQKCPDSHKIYTALPFNIVAQVAQALYPSPYYNRSIYVMQWITRMHCRWTSSQYDTLEIEENSDIFTKFSTLISYTTVRIGWENLVKDRSISVWSSFYSLPFFFMMSWYCLEKIDVHHSWVYL